MSSSNTRFVVAAMLFAAATAEAATLQPSTEALQACANEVDQARRLTCFDRVVGPKPAPVVAAPAAIVPAVSAPAAPAADTYGLATKIKEKPQTLTARVAAVERGPGGALLITLDNDQVWRQSDAASVVVKPGTEIKIIPALLGSYWLQASREQGIRVKRVR